MKRTRIHNFKSIWKLMREHRFTVDPDSIHDNLACVLCKEIMVDASQTLCGCQYCYKCIFDYLDNDGEYCPGECTVKDLMLESDILRKPELNVKILKLRVLCPNPQCEIKTALEDIQEHLNTSVGCGTIGSMKPVKMEPRGQDGLNVEIMMDNFKNELNCLKVSQEKSNLEIESLKEDLRMKERMIEALETKIVNIEHDKRNQEALMNMKLVMQGLQWSELKDMTATTERKLVYYMNSRYLCPEIGEFVWKVKNLSNHRREDLRSIPFLRNDYRFQLLLNISADEVQLCCFLMRGPNDHELEWPMRDRVRLSILDQETLLPHLSYIYQYNRCPRKFRYAFYQPRDEVNNMGIGYSVFVRYSAIVNKSSVVVNDSLIVCFDFVD